MPYKTGKGIMYLISQKIEFQFSFQPEKIFFSAKSHFSFLFGVFLAFLGQALGTEAGDDPRGQDEELHVSSGMFE